MGWDKRGFTSTMTDWAGGGLKVLNYGKESANRYFVHSTDGTDASGYGYMPQHPVASLDYAVSNLCSDTERDVVYLMPGHTETVAAAADIVLDVSRTRIIGIGTGSNRPLFTFDGNIGADIDFDAANVTMENIKFVNTEDGATGPLDINAARCGVKDCFFLDEGTDNTVDWIVIDANGDYFHCIDCWNEGTATGGNDSFITMAAATGVTVKGLRSFGDFAAGNIEMTAAAVDAYIGHCRLENLNAVDVNIEGFAGATGWVEWNCMRNATDAQVTWINTPGALYLFENYGVNNDAESGLLAGTPSV